MNCNLSSPRLCLAILFVAVVQSMQRAQAQPLTPNVEPDRNIKLRVQLDRASISAFEPVYLCISAEQFAENLGLQVSIRKDKDPWEFVSLVPDRQHPSSWTKFESHISPGLPRLKMGLLLLVGQVGDKPRFLFSTPGSYQIRVKIGTDRTTLDLKVLPAAQEDQQAAEILGTDQFPLLFETDHHAKPDEKLKAAADRVVRTCRNSMLANYCEAYLLTAEFRAESLKREPPPPNKAFYGPLATKLDKSADVFQDTFFGEEMGFYAAYAHGLSGDFVGLVKLADQRRSSAFTPWAEALNAMKKDVQKHITRTGLPIPVEVPESELKPLQK